MGDSDTGITTVDVDGVALAAIQGLNLKLAEKGRALEARSQDLEAQNRALRERLTRSEQLVQQLIK